MSATDLAAKLGVTLVTNLCDLVARYFPEPVGHDFDEAAERDLVEREAEQEVAPGRDLFAEHAAHCQGCAAADTDSPDPDSGDADGPAPRTSPTSMPGDGRPTSELLAEAVRYLNAYGAIGAPRYFREFVDELADRADAFKGNRRE